MSSDVGDVVWHLGAVGLQGEEPKYRLEDAVKAKANIIFTVTYTREDEMYHSTPFVSMLDYLKEYESRSEVSIMTPWEARRYFADLLSGGAALSAEYEEKRIVLEQQLRVVQVEIESVQNNNTL